MQMSQASNDSDDDMLSKDQSDSLSMDEGSSRGGEFGGGIVLKKGPWTSTEDAILVDYVKKHGEGNWNAVQKHSGLFRCGKSCRLRWANHLRPNLKKGAFTADEERLIIELHANMGNKWARMAGHLPGRTDNEIKNYWNTRIKRRQRAGLPLYPPDLCLQSFSEGQKNQNDGKFSDGDGRQHDFLTRNYDDIPDVIFDKLKPDPGTLSYAPTFHDISINSMLSQGLGPIQSYSFMPSTISRPKRNREPETMFPDFSGTVSNGLSAFDQFPSESSKKIYHRPFAFGYGFPYDPDPTCKNPVPFEGIVMGSHALLNGNFSASKPLTGAPKLELPSLQYSESDYSTCDTPCASQLLSSEAADTYIQSPQPTVQMQSDYLSPRNSGLLEALLHEAQTLGTMKNRSSDKSSSSSVVTPIDAMDNSGLYLCETEWEEHSDPISPLGRSASSVFSEHTPICGCSLDESPLDKASCGYQIKRGAAEHVSTPDEERKENATRLDFSRPDAWLNADWFDQGECTKDLAALLGDDFCNDYKQMAGASSSPPSQGWGLDSCPWNNMPAVCQMPEFP